MPGMGLDWASIGGQAISDVIGTGMGLLLEGHNDRRQLRQQQALLEQQYKIDNRMADQNFARQLQFWNATNYSAQVEQLKKAGLNPAILYSKGGPGGVTGQQAAHVGSASAPAGGMEIMQMMMNKANIDLIKAQTEKTKAETQNVPLTGQQIQATTSSLLQGIESEKSKQALTNVQTEIANLDKAFQEETFKNRASIINLSLSKLIEEVNIIENDRQISDATKADKIKLIAEEVKNLVQDRLHKQAQTAKTWKESSQIDSQIRLLDQQWDINKIDQEMAKDGFNPKAGNILKLFHNLLRGIASIFN